MAVMSASGSAPREIVSSIRQTDPSATVIARTIYNERHRNRQIELDGRTPIRAVIDELSDSDKYIFNFRVDGDDKVTHLFFVHKESIDLVRRYGSLKRAFSPTADDTSATTTIGTTFWQLGTRWHDLGKELISTGLGANCNPPKERTTGLLLRI
jgi:hypothetical protein